MKFLIFLFSLIASINQVEAKSCQLRKTLKIAIVDTGLDVTDPRFSGHICTKGHKSITQDGLADTNGHGTHIAGLIQKYAGDGNYCFLIFKYYNEKSSGAQNLKNEVSAFQEAIRQGAKIINFSAGGPEFDEQEFLTIEQNPEVTFVVAAGNDSKNIDLSKNKYYPASYILKNVIVVGNVDKDGKRALSSNWGSRVDFVENGENVLSTLPNGNFGLMTGTSQSTAIHTGKMIANKKITCDSENR